MISVLLPTRSRPEMFLESVNSLIQGKNKDLEFLVWLDNDDPYLIEYKGLAEDIDARKQIFISDRFQYDELYKAVNIMITKTSYDWYLLWNDDVYMTNDMWLEMFKSFVEENKFDPATTPIVFNIWGQEDWHANIFPIVSRKYCDILGHFSLHCANDGWTELVAAYSGVYHNLRGIKPYHKRGKINDQVVVDTKMTKTKCRSQTWNFYTEEVRVLIDEDVNKIREYLNGSGP